MSNSSPRPESFWAYFFTAEEFIWQAHQNEYYFIKGSDEIMFFQMSTYAYDKLQPFGPMQMYLVTINKRVGVLLALGYPHDELEDLPHALLGNATHFFGMGPRQVTIVEGKRDHYTAPAEDGQGVDEISICGPPEKSNCEWPEPDPIISPPAMRTFTPLPPRARTPDATPRGMRTPHATSPRAQKTTKNRDDHSTHSYTSFMMGAMLSAIVIIVANNCASYL
ncbi:hypothetical protein RSOLAG22IIIB_03333 [Rhizoctonia solani]|uniref:Uncharacterized protein n=1 Tax=Rhizoctonia solani TaxID=456999 RepID=A0A0K6FP93_9AGAM|nr:hypothetical protein RSOLAG22IIIB_03333 [Rhizoctonia solani]